MGFGVILHGVGAIEVLQADIPDTWDFFEWGRRTLHGIGMKHDITSGILGGNRAFAERDLLLILCI